MQVRTGLISVVAAALCGCSPPAAEPAVATANVVAAHQPSRVRTAQVVGRVDGSETIDLVVGLHLRDKDGLDRRLQRMTDPRSADFRKWLTPSQFAAQHGALAEDYARLIQAFTDAGFEITRLTDGRTSLSIRGRAADVERLFGTRLLLWQDARSGGSPFRAPSADFVLPAAFAGLVETVVGLDDANGYTSNRRGPLPGEASPNMLPGGVAEPADLRTLYGANGATHPVTMQPLLGKGETVAILGTGFSPADADLKGFITKYALPTDAVAQYVRVSLGGANRDPTALANNEYGENVLDIDMVLAMAPLANVVHVFTAANGGGLFADGISFIVNQVPHAHQVSVSYGLCERVSIYEVLQINALLQQAKAEGQAWFFASGDNGTDDCKDASSMAVLAVEWPASSPYAIGVGGTSYIGGGEIAWNFGGGGQSELFPKPVWQEGVGPYPDDGARQVPDVAAMAGDPGVATVFGSTVYPSQGTSAATPIWAGVWALVDEARDNVGMADYHERIYALGKLANGAFNDITAGSNADGDTPGYPAIVGFDLATGWGTPNVAKLVQGLP